MHENMFSGMLQTLLSKKKLKFAITAAINASFAFFISVSIYEILKNYLHIVIIGFICGIAGITFSFLSYKLFVFKTKGNWVEEYIKCYVVYGATMMLSIIGLWFLVDFLHLKFWITNIILQAVCFCLSWIGHNRFTFKKFKKSYE